MNKKKNISKRNLSFRHSDSPLTSERVSVILSNKKDSALLTDAVRGLRHSIGKNISFKISDETKKKLRALENS